MDDAGWDTLPNGNIRSGPLLGWKTAAAQMFALVQLRYAESEQEYESGGKSLQLTMTPVQLRTLAEALLRKAVEIEAQHPGLAQ